MPSHHAVAYFVDDYTATSPFLADIEAESELELVEVAKLSIADVRRVIVSANSRPFATQTKVIYIATGHIAVEAQNALLKILEDPPATTKFVLWLGRQVELLPTVRSRVQVQTYTDTTDSIAPTTFHDLLRMTVPERLARIAEIYKQKDITADRQLYQGLVNYLHTPPTILTPGTLAELATLQSLLTSPGASKKMLWEALALALPVE